MKQDNYSVNIHWDGRSPKAGTNLCPVQLGVNLNGLQFKIGLKLYATKDDFEKAMLGKGGNHEIKQLREEINKFRQKAKEILDNLPNPTRETFQRLFKSDADLGKGKTDITILFEDYNNDLVKEDRLKSAQINGHTLKSLHSYKPKIYLEEIDDKFLKGYVNWMLNKGNSYSTAQIYLRNLRTVYNRAINDGFIAKKYYPFTSFTIGSSSKSKNVLYPEQVKALFDYVPQTFRQHKAKDIWIFCYLMNGVNPKDMFYLKWENVKEDYIIFTREKTKRTKRNSAGEIRAYLHPEMKRIVSDYGTKDKSPDNYVFPFLLGCDNAEQRERRRKNAQGRLNDWLKDIGENIGLPIRLVLNLARHSFSTNLKLNDVPSTFIKDALGHSSIAVTEHYLKTIPDRKIKEISSHLLNFKNDSEN